MRGWNGSQGSERRNAFTRVREPEPQIDLFVQRCSADASPFPCTAAADSMLQKIEKIAQPLPATSR